MTSEHTPDHAREALESYGDLFRSAPDADTPGQPQTLPDESEAAMTRLRAPFDAGPVDAHDRRT
jgi:hypothetical protein